MAALVAERDRAGHALPPDHGGGNAGREIERLAAQASTLLSCPDVLAEFRALCGQVGLVGEEKNAQLLYLAFTSRLLEKPVSAVVKGPSGGGKSFLVQRCRQVFPPSAYYALSGMSEHAIVYGTETLVHRMLVLCEAAALSSEFATYGVRSLVSEGRVKYETVEMPERGPGGGRVLEREGPTGLITTTTRVCLDAELETRLLSLSIRDDPQQTQSILASIAERANGRGPAPADLERWRAFQEWLAVAGVHEVSIPYAGQLAARCEATAVRLRRDFGALLSLVKAHAIVHQAQRRIVDGRIVAEIADYRAVHGLVAELLNEGAQAMVTPTIRETVEALRALYLAAPVTMRALAKRLGLDKTSTTRRVAVARRRGGL